MAAAPAIVPIGPLATSALVWKWREACHVTVTAKATFALQQHTVMSPIVAEPLEDHEVVPYRDATDVVVIAAHAFSPTPTEATAVRLVLRGTKSHIDKSLLVYAPRPGGIVAPFQQAAIVQRRGRPTALVIDPKDPSKRGTYGRTEQRVPTMGDGGDGALLLDDDVDFNTFQCAPPDQRVSGLGGDEWLIFEGMTPGTPRFESRMPGALVETRIYPPDLWCGRSLPVSMAPCAVSIDIDNHKCSVVWRGGFTVDGPSTASELTLVSALHLPGVMTSWPTVDGIVASVEGQAHAARLAALADTDRSGMHAAPPIPPAADKTANLEDRVQARLRALGPLATMPVSLGTEPIEGAPKPVDHGPRMVVQRQGTVMLRPNDPLELSVTDTGTIDLPPERTELAAPVSTAVTLRNMPGAPWSREASSWADDAARRGASGTLLVDTDDTPPELDEQDIDTLEQTLTDSLDEMQGDPIAELFDVGRIKKP